MPTVGPSWGGQGDCRVTSTRRGLTHQEQRGRERRTTRAGRCVCLSWPSHANRHRTFGAEDLEPFRCDPSSLWRYTLRDLTSDHDPETWARELAAEGWRLWIPGNAGATVTIHGRTVRRYSLRRWAGEGPPPPEPTP